jgi:hypothetical protein
MGERCLGFGHVSCPSFGVFASEKRHVPVLTCGANDTWEFFRWANYRDYDGEDEGAGRFVVCGS